MIWEHAGRQEQSFTETVDWHIQDSACSHGTVYYRYTQSTIQKMSGYTNKGSWLVDWKIHEV